MAKNEGKKYNLGRDPEVLKRHQAGSQLAAHLARKNKPKRQTRGKDKNADTCRLTPLCGMPRKFWKTARAYKHPSYAKAMAFFDGLKGNGRV